jgi:hypothetical protein
MNFPAAAQLRNDIKKEIAKIALARRTVFPALNWKVANATARRDAIANPKLAEVEFTIHSLMRIHSSPKTKL